MNPGPSSASSPGARPFARILSGFASLAGGRLVTGLLGLVGTGIISRHLGTDGFGAFTLVVVLVASFDPLTNLGLRQIAVREAAADPALRSRIAGHLLVLGAGLGLLAALLCAGTAWCSGYPAATVSLALLMAPNLLLSGLRRVDADLHATSRFGVLSAINVASAVLALMLYAAGAAYGRGLRFFVLAVLASSGLAVLLSLLAVCRRCRPDFRLDRRLAARLLVEGLPIGLSTFLLAIYLRIQVFLLATTEDLAAVGCYNAASKLCDLMSIGGSMLVSVVYPQLAAAHKAGPADRARVATMGLASLLAMAGAAALVLAAAAGPLIRAIYGDGFSAAAPVLRILALVLLPAFANLLFTHLFIVAGRTGFSLLLMGGGGLASLGLGLLLVPRWGAPGAACATLLAETGMALAAMLALRHAMPGGIFCRSTLRRGLSPRAWRAILRP